VAVCCEFGGEPSDSGATDLVTALPTRSVENEWSLATAPPYTHPFRCRPTED
jgi:hypothetical protein